MPGITHTHDGVLHMARIAAYSRALFDGEFPVRWAGNLNYGYGTPLFIFYYPLPYFIGSLLHGVGINFTASFKILLGIPFVLAPVFFYFWLRKMVNPLAALAASFVYGLAPYHFLDLYVRGDVGELFALAFIPLVFWSVEKINDRFSPASVIVGALFYCLLILSHNAFALLFSPIFVFYGLVRFGYRKTFWKNFAIMFLLGLGLSAFFWLPALVEQKYTHSNLFVSSTYKENFPTLAQLIWSPWGFGTKVNSPDGLSPQIGLIGLLFTFFAAILYKKMQKFRPVLLFCIVLFVLAVFLSLKISSVFWDRLPFLQKFEFPWRLTALSVFATSIIAARVLSVKKLGNVMVFIIAVIIIAGIPFVRTVGNDTKPDSFYLTYPSSTEFGAASTIWSAGDPSAYPKEPVAIIGGRATISDFRKSLREHIFTLVAQTDAIVLDNTLYFPGWQVLVDNQKVPIQFQDANYRGLITFQVPKGTHTTMVRFTNSPIRFFSNLVTALSATTALFLFFRHKKYIIKP